MPPLRHATLAISQISGKHSSVVLNISILPFQMYCDTVISGKFEQKVKLILIEEISLTEP